MTALEIVTPVAATGFFTLAWLLIAIPLASAAVLLLVGRSGDSWGHYLGALAPIASFVIGVCYFAQLFGRDEGSRAVTLPLYDWISTGRWHISAGLLIDQLSIVFVLLITGVGGLIHVYSIGYMAHDDRRRRFFAFLNLFVAAMLLLVLADNYLVLFVGWEGVGLASYLLIGFWQYKPTAATAAKKAFVVNRVGDMGMSLAVMLMLATFGSSAFADVDAGMPAAGGTIATIMGLLLLLGACGKSAQVPLQSWLLDAMEGPTPVSALIHAATMVTAGVYLVTRSHAVYAESPAAGTAVVIVGTVTLLAGAWIGCAKDDIKKVLAGSTMSQIGYMMLAAGIGPAGYAFAIFHLLTHGFFKANMFLGAGSVMHAMNDDVNMRHYGALARVLPITFATFATGYLAIIGFPFLSGYYSKDHIIEAAFERSTVVGVLALIGAGVTAFYMTRLMLMTFFGSKRWSEAPAEGGTGIVRHPHEAPRVMTIPLILLALGSVFGGAVLNNWINGWLEPATGGAPEGGAEVPGLLHFSAIGVLTLAIVAIGVLMGFLLFGPHRRIPTLQPESSSPFTLAGRNDLYGDAFNEAVFMRPGQRLTAGLVRIEDDGIDGTVNGTAAAIGGLSARLRRVQNGFVRTYALTMVAGAAVVGVVLVLGRMG
jgi:NADH-quinone oxidoreductase subunit L